MAVGGTIIENRATIDDLYRVEEKAELVNGQIHVFSPSEISPGFAEDEIRLALREFSKSTGKGRAAGGRAAFLVNLPHRQSFSPSAAYFIGPRAGMKCFASAPIFAAEVRNSWDYGNQIEAQRKQKRDDYFAAGTLVVWDVDLLSNDVIRVYRASDPNSPTCYRRGEIAEAEPAVPGWKFPVDQLFTLEDAE